MFVGILTNYKTFSGNCNVWPFVHILLMFIFIASNKNHMFQETSHASRGSKHIASYKCLYKIYFRSPGEFDRAGREHSE